MTKKTTKIRVKATKPSAKQSKASSGTKKKSASPAPVATTRHLTDEQRLVLQAKAAKGPNGKHLQLLLNIRDRLLDGIEFHASDNLRRTQKDASSDLSAYSFHMADAGTDNFDREFALSMVSNEQELLYEINEAIKRIENGTYGLCEMSGKPIPKPRLDAIPWTRYTVECQEEIEKTQQRRQPQTFQLSDFGNSEEEVVEREEEE
jgi:RNA polymerase-binding transcription factor DksA